jgi:ABC-2 type transport system ATP-binding protein
MLSLRKDGKAVFLSSHILSELENVADRIAIIRRGSIIKVVERSDLSNLGNLSMKIQIKNPDENVESVLQKFGNVSKDRNVFKITEMKISKDDAYVISDALSKAGYRINSMGTESEGLEEYFLELVGGGK